MSSSSVLFYLLFHSSGAEIVGVTELSSKGLSLSEPSCRFGSPKRCTDHLFLLASATLIFDSKFFTLFFSPPALAICLFVYLLNVPSLLPITYYAFLGTHSRSSPVSLSPGPCYALQGVYHVGISLPYPPWHLSHGHLPAVPSRAPTT